MTVNSLLCIVEGRVIAYLKGLEVGILKIDIDLHHDLDQCICHASLSRPDLVTLSSQGQILVILPSRLSQDWYVAETWFKYH